MCNSHRMIFSAQFSHWMFWMITLFQKKQIAFKSKKIKTDFHDKLMILTVRMSKSRMGENMLEMSRMTERQEAAKWLPWISI